MTGLCVTVVALLFVCGAASRSEVARRTLFKRMMQRSRTLAKEAPAPGGGKEAPAAAPMAAPAAAPAGSCECSFQDMCTCESALAHLDCISKTCASEECDCPAVQFSQSCGQIASVCKPMLDISCTPEEALCDGKFYQLSSSLAGLSIDLEKLDDDAHCSSTGKCTGQLDVQAAIHNSEKGMVMECFLEDSPGSKEKTHCSNQVSGDSANCTLPMPSSLPAGGKLEGWCRLRSNSTRLTHDAPFYIYNHNKAAVADTPKKKYAPARLKAPPKSGAFGSHGIVVVLAALGSALFF